MCIQNCMCQGQFINGRISSMAVYQGLAVVPTGVVFRCHLAIVEDYSYILIMCSLIAYMARTLPLINWTILPTRGAPTITAASRT